jgi:hypothetical protein
VPEGVAMIGLGISLWRDQRRASAVAASQPVTPEAAVAR